MTGRERFNFSTEVRVRLPETDAFGIVFHANFFIYFDVARVDYLRNLDALRFISPEHARNNALVHATADFRSPARFDDVLVVHARIAEIGRSSFAFEFLTTHKAANRLVATGRTTLVVVDEASFRPVPVPEEFRALVRKFEGEALSEARTP